MRDIITESLRIMCAEANPKVQDLFDKQTGRKLTVKGARVVNTLVALAHCERPDSVLFDGHRADEYTVLNVGLANVINYNHRVGYNSHKIDEGTYILSTTAKFEYYAIKKVQTVKTDAEGKNLANEDSKTKAELEADLKAKSEGADKNAGDFYFDGETDSKKLTGSVFADQLKAELIEEIKDYHLVDESKRLDSYKGKEHEMLLSPTSLCEILTVFAKKIGRTETCSFKLTKKNVYNTCH